MGEQQRHLGMLVLARGDRGLDDRDRPVDLVQVVGVRERLELRRRLAGTRHECRVGTGPGAQRGVEAGHEHHRPEPRRPLVERQRRAIAEPAAVDPAVAEDDAREQPGRGVRRRAAATDGGRRHGPMRERVRLPAPPELQQRLDLRVRRGDCAWVLGRGGASALRRRDRGRPLAAEDLRARRQEVRRHRRRVRCRDRREGSRHDRRLGIAHRLQRDHRRADIQRRRAPEHLDVIEYRIPLRRGCSELRRRRPGVREGACAPQADAAVGCGIRTQRVAIGGTARRPRRGHARRGFARAEAGQRADGGALERRARRHGHRPRNRRVDRGDGGRRVDSLVEAGQGLAPVAEGAVGIVVGGAIERRPRVAGLAHEQPRRAEIDFGGGLGRHDADIATGAIAGEAVA